MHGEWVKVSDRLPKTHETYKGSPLTSDHVLTFNGFNISIGRYEQTYTTRKYRWIDARGYLTSITHWMPYTTKPDKE
jgi:hypothetical protein